MSTTRKAPEPTPPEPWTPERRSLNARYASHDLHAQVADESAHTAPARAAFMGRFEREVDPDGVLSPEDRERRARHARKAYFLKLQIASSKARSRKQAEQIEAEGPRRVRGG